MPTCAEHRYLVKKITEVSESLHGLRGELRIVYPEIKESNKILNGLSKKIAEEEMARKASWKTITISVGIGALLSGFVWSFLSFVQRAV